VGVSCASTGKPLERAIGSGCLSERLIREIDYDRVQLGVERTNALDDGCHHLGTRKPPVADTSSDFDGAFLPKRLTHDEGSSTGKR